MPTPSPDDGDTPSGQAAYRRLLDDIRRGELAPGTRLRETDLADRLGISRTPVREAIRMLEQDGLVIHLPRQGATVRRMDYAELIELYEMRAVLEGTAARLAARGASEVELAELGALNDLMGATQDPHLAREVNRQFHQALLAAAKNRFLSRSINALQKTMLLLGPTTLIAPDRAKAAVAEHGRVLKALQARDGARAEAEMRAHLDGALRTRIRGFRAGDPVPEE
jgi:DNA-binding GntR family transcriptional regulator